MNKVVLVLYTCWCGSGLVFVQNAAAQEVEAAQKKELAILKDLDLSQYKIKGSEHDWKQALNSGSKMISIKGYGIHWSLQRSTPSIHRSLQRSTLDQRGKVYTGHCRGQLRVYTGHFRGQLWIKGVKYTQVTAEVNSEYTQVTSEVNSGSKMISIPDQRGKVQYRPNTT
jgi:hypothetical protein